MGDKASAKEHSDRGKEINERKSYVASGLDLAHSRFDPMKAAFEQAKIRQSEVLEQLKDARAAKNRKLDELKEAKSAEEAHWHEKACQRCGAIIRYRDDWSHEPNFCKNCKEKFAEERAAKEAAKKEREAKWQEKPCKSCGTMIRYNVDWTNPPNYCADCKERFKAEQEYKLRYNLVWNFFSNFLSCLHTGFITICCKY